MERRELPSQERIRKRKIQVTRNIGSGDYETEMKEKARKKYLSEHRKLLENRFGSKNLIKGQSPEKKFTWPFLQYKLVTIAEGDPKAPFSIATTPRCRGGHYSFPWIAPLYP